MKTFTLETAQQRVDEIQAVYREWLALQPRLEQAKQDWQRSIELMAEMEAFYFGEGAEQSDYSILYDAYFSDGMKLDLTTAGEYSVLDQDTLWDAFTDQQAQAWQRLRSALKVLDKGGEHGNGK